MARRHGLLGFVAGLSAACAAQAQPAPEKDIPFCAIEADVRNIRLEILDKPGKEPDRAMIADVRIRHISQLQGNGGCALKAPPDTIYSYRVCQPFISIEAGYRITAVAGGAMPGTTSGKGRTCLQDIKVIR